MSHTLQVLIYKVSVRRWMNLFWAGHSMTGVSWDGSVLTFSGDSYESMEQTAICFWETCTWSELRNVRARMKHRFGRNGHDWPPLQGDSVDWSPILAAIKEVARRGGPYARSIEEATGTICDSGARTQQAPQGEPGNAQDGEREAI